MQVYTEKPMLKFKEKFKYTLNKNIEPWQNCSGSNKKECYFRNIFKYFFGFES